MSDEYHDTNLTYGNGYECGECASLEREIKRIRIELDHRRSVMSRFPFCQDHRDKVAGKECRECEIEQLRSLLSAREAALEKANAALLSMTDAIQKLLEVLPDAARASDCWTWCWDELDGNAQDEVKTARAHAVSVMLATAAHATSAETARGEGGEAK